MSKNSLCILSDHLPTLKDDGISLILSNYISFLGKYGSHYHLIYPTSSSSPPSRAKVLFRYMISLSPYSVCKSRYNFSDIVKFFYHYRFNFRSIHVFGYSLSLLKILLIVCASSSSVTVSLVDSMSLHFYRRCINSSSFISRLLYFLEFLRCLAYENILQLLPVNITYVSQVDLRSFKISNCYFPSSLYCVPNGIDVNYFAPKFVSKSEELRLVFYGDLDYSPNIDCVNFLLDYAADSTTSYNVDIHLAGKCSYFSKFNGIASIHYHGYVEDLRTLFTSNSLFVCPMSTGSGVKNKILECLAMHVPVLCTSVASDGISEFLLDYLNIYPLSEFEEFIHRFASSATFRSGLREVFTTLPGNSLLSWDSIAQQYFDLAA